MSASAQRREELAVLVKHEFDESGETYGYRRVHAGLVRKGVEVDDDLVRKLMRRQGLMPVQVKRRRAWPHDGGAVDRALQTVVRGGWR
jgi:hypothetical protein